jgi:cytochrome P450
MSKNKFASSIVFPVERRSRLYCKSWDVELDNWASGELSSMGIAFAILGVVLISGIALKLWYGRLVVDAQGQICDSQGGLVPGETPKIIVGNLVDVYRAKNQLSAYHAFHEKYGEIVQIFWMWRQQISVTNYAMIRRIIVDNQKNYEKFRPNSVIQRLYGSSVLTNSGEDWKRHRLLLKEVFSQKHVIGLHSSFVTCTNQLVGLWKTAIEKAGDQIQLDIYPDLTALFLDIIGKTAIGCNFGALNGEADTFLENLNYITSQSTRPVHQFTRWWKRLPLPSNRKLSDSFAAIDEFLYDLIRQRRAENQNIALHDSPQFNVLDLLLKATDFVDEEVQPLTDKEVRDNLLAIIVNGYETVATCAALSLYLLAQHPQKLMRAQAEVDRAIEQTSGLLTDASVSELNYLKSTVLESLRLYPPMAGLQRISLNADVLEGWSIPSRQVVAATLMPLHRNPEYFGSNPEQFQPERYLPSEQSPDQAEELVNSESTSSGKCPLKFIHPYGKSNRQNKNSNRTTKPGVSLPLSFGDGARKCLGEHFAMYEMTIVLAMLIHHFDIQVPPNFEVELELGKFGLFISMLPKAGVQLMLRHRHAIRSAEIAAHSEQVL